MADKIARRAREKKSRPVLEVHPRAVRSGDLVVVRGEGLGDSPVEIEIGGEARRPIRVAQGAQSSGGVRPDGAGSFVVTVTTFGIKPGRHRVVARSTHRTRRLSASQALDVSARPEIEFGPRGADEREEPKELPYLRALDFFKRRFGHLGFVPPGTRETQVRQIRMLREKQRRDRQE